MGLWISSDPRRSSCFCHASALHPLSRSSSEVGPDRGASAELQRVHVCVFNFCHSPSNLSAARGFGPEQSLISALHRGPGYHQWVKCDSRVCVCVDISDVGCVQMSRSFTSQCCIPYSVGALFIPQSFRYLCRGPARFVYLRCFFILIYYVFRWRAGHAGARQ